MSQHWDVHFHKYLIFFNLLRIDVKYSIINSISSIVLQIKNIGKILKSYQVLQFLYKITLKKKAPICIFMRNKCPCL